MKFEFKWMRTKLGHCQLHLNSQSDTEVYDVVEFNNFGGRTTDFRSGYKVCRAIPVRLLKLHHNHGTSKTDSLTDNYNRAIGSTWRVANQGYQGRCTFSRLELQRWIEQLDTTRVLRVTPSRPPSVLGALREESVTLK